jgi:GIY-YIG catalytic domain
VAEGARLESVFGGNSNVGSNPTLSAISPQAKCPELVEGRNALSKTPSDVEGSEHERVEGLVLLHSRVRGPQLLRRRHDDLEDRVNEHNSGHGAQHTRLRRPVRLVWSRACTDYAEARSLETRLKGWSREKKRLLIVGSLRLD